MPAPGQRVGGREPPDPRPSGRRRRPHEIAAIPELLRVLDLKGALVTPDAAGCQKEIAKRIRKGEGHYLLPVKGNQPTLHAAVSEVFDRACESDFAGVKHDGHEAVEDGHGRHEEWYITVIYDPEGLPPSGRTWRRPSWSGGSGR